MNSTAPQLFTAAEIASALGRKRQNVGVKLAAVAPRGTKIVSGNEARAWAVEDLPPVLRLPLQVLARRQGCADAQTALRQSAAPWPPTDFPKLADCHEDALAQARKLREAMRQAINRQAAGLSATEFESRGVEDHRRVLGYAITARHWRELFRRTLQRAGSNPDFERLELYLAERPKLRSQAPPAGGDDDATTARLRQFLSSCGEASNASPRDCEGLWTEALLAFDELLASGESESGAGRAVRAALRAVAPWLAASADALQKAFARHLEKWVESGRDARSQRDRRRDNTGNHDHFELPQADVDALVHLAAWHYHGHIAAGWRHAQQRGLLSPGTVARYPLSADKSHVPHKVRETIAPEVELFMKMKRGQRATDELTPHISRDYSGVFSCQAFMADDFTLPVYFYVPNSAGWFDLVRGQCLLFIDFRSLKIIGWSFQQDPNYSSLVIRSLCTHVFSELCIPEILYFERGIWQRSTLITGRNPDGALPFGEVVQGMREFGIRFIHAIRPRTKTIERVGGLLQDLMEGEPGYCGRFERSDLPAHTKSAMDQVRAKKVHPSKHFFSFEQWHARLGEVIARYNAAPQQGRILDGLSPEQGFDQFMNPENPPIQLGAELLYLLAHHKEEREVTTNGIQFRIGKNRFRYYGPEFGRLVGRRVLCWLDPENPGSLVVTDLDRRNPIMIPRAQEVSALAALTGGEETLAAELGRAAGQMAHLKARYAVVKSRMPLPHRIPLADTQVECTGTKIAEMRKEVAQRDRTTERTQRSAKKSGMYVPQATRGREGIPEALDQVARFLELPAEEEGSNT